MFGCAQETKTLRGVWCKEGSYSCKVPIKILDIVKGWLSACNGVIKYDQRLVFLTTPSGERIEYEDIQPLPEEYENDLLEDVYTEDSKVGYEFLDVSVGEQTPLEEINKIDDHAYANYPTKKGPNAQGAM